MLKVIDDQSQSTDRISRQVGFLATQGMKLYIFIVLHEWYNKIL